MFPPPPGNDPWAPPPQPLAAPIAAPSNRGLYVVLTAAIAFATFGAGLFAGTRISGDDDERAALPVSSQDPPPAPPRTRSLSPFPSRAAGGPCRYEPDQEAYNTDLPGLPPATGVRTTGRVPVILQLGQGPVRMELFADRAPCTVHSFLFLARSGFYDATRCHRLTSSSGLSVLQCGDPSGRGAGGPGYQFADENLAGATYRAGTVAMANAGPGTNGSQFFIVYEDSRLPPNYTVFGRVTAGLDVVREIAKQGSVPPTDGSPRVEVLIRDVAVG